MSGRPLARAQLTSPAGKGVGGAAPRAVRAAAAGWLGAVGRCRNLAGGPRQHPGPRRVGPPQSGTRRPRQLAARARPGSADRRSPAPRQWRIGQDVDGPLAHRLRRSLHLLRIDLVTHGVGDGPVADDRAAHSRSSRAAHQSGHPRERPETGAGAPAQPAQGVTAMECRSRALAPSRRCEPRSRLHPSPRSPRDRKRRRRGTHGRHGRRRGPCDGAVRRELDRIEHPGDVAASSRASSVGRWYRSGGP